MHPESDVLKDELCAQLRADDALSSFILEESLSGASYLDPDRPAAEWISPRFWSLLGYSAREVNNANAWRLSRIHPDDRQRAGEALKQLLGTPGQFGDEIIRYVHRDGSTLWIRCRTLAIAGDDGASVRLFNTYEQLTDRQADLADNPEPAVCQGPLEEDASTPGEMARGVVETVRQPLLILDGGLCVMNANHAFYELFGGTVDTVTGSCLFSLNQDAWDIPELRTLLADVLPHNIHVRNFAVRQSFPGIGIKQLVLDARRISLESEPTRHILLAIEDCTERLMLEEQLRQSQRMEAIGRLAGGIAHDFNNQLTAIMGFADLAVENLPADHPGRAWLDEIRLAARRSSEITRGLLAFGRKQLMNLQSLDLNEVLEGMQVFLARLLGEDIELNVSLEPVLAKIVGDRTQLEQVIVNLAINARDAMPEGGLLRIKTSRLRLDRQEDACPAALEPGDYVELSVTDTGEGMDSEVASQIFEPFFTTKNANKGTGLGLSTAHGIVKQHGGHITVHSEPGKGASFRLCFPASANETKRSRTDAAPANPSEGDAAILYVEDNDSVRRLFERILRSAGFTVVAAAGPEQAIDMVAGSNVKPSLIVSDFDMPAMDGARMIRELEPYTGEVPVLFLSGFAEDVISGREELSQSEFLQKPVTPQVLLEKVRIFLGGTPADP